MSSVALTFWKSFLIVCACGESRFVYVEQLSTVYAEINRLGWGLIPTQHGYHIQGVCPRCRIQLDQHQGGVA